MLFQVLDWQLFHQIKTEFLIINTLNHLQVQLEGKSIQELLLGNLFLLNKNLPQSFAVLRLSL